MVLAERMQQDLLNERNVLEARLVELRSQIKVQEVELRSQIKDRMLEVVELRSQIGTEQLTRDGERELAAAHPPSAAANNSTSGLSYSMVPFALRKD